MKKTLLTALTVMVAMTAGAADRVVYQNGALGGDYKSYDWWNVAKDFNATNPDGEGYVFSFKANDGGAAASMGIYADTESTCPGPLHSATLNFKWYATTAGQTYTVRLTSIAEGNYSFTTTEENIGKWNSEALVVSEKYPTVAEQWNANENDGAGYIFSIILDNGKENSIIYFDDIYYSNVDESWTAPVRDELPAPTTVPVPAHDAANVVSIFGSAYPAATTFGIGGWGQATQTAEKDIDGKKAMKVTRFNYLGWEFAQHIDATSCNMMHVDFFASNEGSFGFTPISPGAEKAWVASEVKVGEWNSYDVALTHWDNVNFADVSQIKFDQGNGSQEGYIANVYFYKDENVKGPEHGAVWYGHAEDQVTKNGKDYNLAYDYAFTANEDGSLGIEISIDGEEDLDPGHQVHVVSAKGDEWVTLVKEGETWVGKTGELSFELGEKVTEIEIYLPFAGGLSHPFIRDYVFGASNEKPVAAIKPAIKASAENITATGAEIAYTVTLPAELEGADVKVFCNETEATASPVVLTGLTQNTAYSYTLKAVATLGEDTYESNPVKIEFRTLRDDAQPLVWHTIADGMINNAYLPGEDAAVSRRAIPASIETTVTYNPEGTITVDAVFHGKEVVGFVPKITISSADYKFEYKDMVKVENGKYTITTDTEYPVDHNIGWLYYFLAYDGGNTNINVSNYTTGLENDPVAYGEASSLELALSKSTPKVSESVIATAIVKDANNHFLLDEISTLDIDNASFTINGDVITASEKGVATLTATSGSLTATAEIKCVASANATRLINEDTATYTASSGNAALAFDSNEGTQVEWNCAETEEHWISVDLGEVKNIEAIEVVWEGASATHYTVALSTTATEQNRAVSQNGNVFTVENGEGGAGITPRLTLYPEDLKAIKARHVTLNTSKAHNAGWGIKLKELNVIGTTGVSGIENVEAECEGAVEYFNLQGVRVENPESGLYIRRQGNKATKVLVK